MGSEVGAGVFDSATPDPSLPLVFSFSFMLQQASSTHAQPLWGLTHTHGHETDGPSYSIKRAR